MLTPSPPEQERKTFDYSALFKQKIAAKKAEHSYRIFKKVSRVAGRFPMAHEFTERKKEVTVWCSNDYLGEGLGQGGLAVVL